MIQKTIGLYSATSNQSPFNKDTLIIEVGNFHVVCLVKSEKNKSITAFEFFKIEVDNNDWSEIFYELRTNSDLMDKSYNNTLVFYHFEQSVLIPAYKFNASVTEAYLNLIHGEAENSLVKTEMIVLGGEKIYNAFRISKSLQESVNRNFLSLSEHHIYSGILNYTFSDSVDKSTDVLLVNFYYKHLVITAVINNQLQIIQSYSFETAEDVLYHLLNIAEKFKMAIDHCNLTVSGILDTNDLVFKNIQQYFRNVHLNTIDFENSSLEKFSAYPSHYFTPFFNLMA